MERLSLSRSYGRRVIDSALSRLDPLQPVGEHVFVHRESSNHKGAVAEAKIMAAAIELGVRVLRPMSEHGRYDLVFQVADRLLKVQCKWASRSGDVVVVNLSGSYLSPRGYVRSTYRADEIDAIAAYGGDTGDCFLLPIGLVGWPAPHPLAPRPAQERPARGAKLGS